MNGFFESAYWCTLQVTLVTIFGLAWSSLAAWRSSARACSIVCVTVVAATFLTMVSPLPIHGWITAPVDFLDSSAGEMISADLHQTLNREFPQSAGQPVSNTEPAGISLS